MFSGLNTSDPLDLFSDPMQEKRARSKNGVILFNGENYMLTATLKIRVADVEGSQKLYDEVHAIVDGYGSDVIAFAPHFFTAENSAKIKSEVNLIITATMILLLLFYAFTLRDYKVLILTSIALGSSLFVGLSAVTFLFEDVSIFTLAFGSGTGGHLTLVRVLWQRATNSGKRPFLPQYCTNPCAFADRVVPSISSKAIDRGKYSSCPNSLVV